MTREKTFVNIVNGSFIHLKYFIPDRSAVSIDKNVFEIKGNVPETFRPGNVQHEKTLKQKISYDFYNPFTLSTLDLLLFDYCLLFKSITIIVYSLACLLSYPMFPLSQCNFNGATISLRLYGCVECVCGISLNILLIA